MSGDTDGRVRGRYKMGTDSLGFQTQRNVTDMGIYKKNDLHLTSPKEPFSNDLYFYSIIHANRCSDVINGVRRRQIIGSASNIGGEWNRESVFSLQSPVGSPMRLVKNDLGQRQNGFGRQIRNGHPASLRHTNTDGPLELNMHVILDPGTRRVDTHCNG